MYHFQNHRINIRAALTLITIMIFFNPLVLPAKEIIVDKNGAVRTIHQALKIAVNNDTLIIQKGFYAEGDIVVDRQVKIIGENHPTIDGLEKSEVFTVIANNVTISGLTIQNAGVSFLSDNAGIKLEKVNGCIIENNKLLNNFFAIYLAKSFDCIISQNYIEAHGLSETTSGNGIHLWYCKNITIKNNTIMGQRDGIYFEFVRDGKISGNLSKYNLRYGLHFMFSDSCKYWNNTFENNSAGVAVMYTNYVQMINNTFQNNWGPASYGLLLKEIKDSYIAGNRFLKNTTGLYMEGCERVTVLHNEFLSNGWAINLMASSAGNYFSQNNFLSNSFDVETNSSQNFNTFSGNYWSKYEGYDLNKDGIGDVPFRPVRFFSMLVAQQPSSIVLLHSLFINILDVAESVIPSITPATLIDKKPMMRIIN